MKNYVIMKKSIFYLSLLAGLFTACTSQQDAGIKVDRIHVEGNRFVNESGETFVFKGLCLSDPVKMINDGQWSERVFAEAENWGANVVRFAVHPSNLNRMGWDETFQAMDQGIEWAKQHNLYVVMDWHSIGNLKDEKYTNPMYNTTLDETFRFWKTVATRYKDEPTVALYELFNEPTYTAKDLGQITWTEWKGILEQVIDTIRVYNPDALCMCAGFNWAYDLTPVATEPIARENVAYVSHPYPMKREAPWEEKWEADYGYVADTYPVFCTELGYCHENERGSHIPVIGDDTYAEHITQYFEQKGISYTVWCFDPDWGPMLIKDWDYTPTIQGQFFRSYLQQQSAPINAVPEAVKVGEQSQYAFSWLDRFTRSRASIEAVGEMPVLDLGSDDGYYDLTPEAGALIQQLRDFTISVYFNVASTNALDGYGHFLFAFSELAENKADAGPYMAMRLNEQRFETSTGGWEHEEIVMQGGQPARDVWVHALFRQSGKHGELYLDGQLIGSNDNMPILSEIFTVAPAHCWIGRAPFHGDKYLSDTKVADFRIYDYAVSDEEVKQLCERKSLLK